MEKLKTLIVENSSTYRKFFTEAVNDTSFGIVEQAVWDTDIMFSLMSQKKIDVVLIDADLLTRTGTGVLKRLTREHPEVEMVIIGNESAGGDSITDYIVKPSEDNLTKNMAVIKNQLQTIFAQIKVRSFTAVPAAGGVSKPSEVKGPIADSREILDRIVQEGIDLVLIASSTGGPMALETLFHKLPADFKVPVLVVQHMPSGFTKALAEKLDKKLTQEVREGKNGEKVQPGYVFIAPGDRHMIVDKEDDSNRKIRLLDTSSVNGVRPSADVLFYSAANAYKGKNVLAVILTGMGNDGMQGVLELKQKCNCYCIIQSESTCVVYGMPKCVHEAGLSDETADIKDIGFRIYQISKGRR
ncbi:MAG: chemotaxis protein CheB [Bacillota bacterium]